MEENLGSNSQVVKKNNCNLILNLIVTNDEISRIEIARKTGLSKMTVSNIINELINKGILCETSVITNNSVGRHPITLDISDGAPYLCGINICRDNFVVVISTLKLNIIESVCVKLDCNEDNQSIIKKLFDAIDNFRKKFENRIIGIGISSIGPVDTASGTILFPPNFHNIRDLNIVSKIEAHTEIPTYIDNDMNTSALCERLFGIGKSIDDFIYIGITNGIGAGIVSGSKLLTGSGGFAGEIGHTTVDPQGETCYCHNKGCLENYASIPNIIKNMNDSSALDMSFESISEKYKDNESFIKAMNIASDYLAVAITNLCNILDPQTVIIGHEGYFIPEEFLLKIEKNVNSKILTKGYKSINIIKSDFKNEIPIMGSLSLVLSRIFNGELTI